MGGNSRYENGQTKRILGDIRNSLKIPFSKLRKARERPKSKIFSLRGRLTLYFVIGTVLWTFLRASEASEEIFLGWRKKDTKMEIRNEKSFLAGKPRYETKKDTKRGKVATIRYQTFSYLDPPPSNTLLNLVRPSLPYLHVLTNLALWCSLPKEHSSGL